MTSNLDRFKKDLKALIATGDLLEIAMQKECFPGSFGKPSGDKKKDEALKKVIEGLPSFGSLYQKWYSESIALLTQVLPSRLADFIKYYEKPKTRKEITYENYRIEDYLQGLSVTRGAYKEKVVGPDGAIPHFRQQLAIVKAAEARFESSIFEIKQLVQADLFDGELDAAGELLKQNFLRAAGALAGVVIERHLSQVCLDRSIPATKKNPSISDFSETLKSAGAIDIPQWRFIQHLADIRNLCDHSKKAEPTREQVSDLVEGAKKVIKTVF